MLGRLYNGVCATLGAAASAQFPAFYTQYLQHLSGRLHQARESLANVMAGADREGLSVPRYLDLAQSEGGSRTARIIEDHRATHETMERLETAYAALRGADAVERPIVFAAHLRSDIAQAAFHDFTPALPISIEGLVYAVAGVLIGIAAAWSSERPLVLLRRSRQARRTHLRRNTRRSDNKERSEGA